MSRDDFALGGAVGYSYYDVDFETDQNNPSDQDLDSNSVIFSFFGTYFPNSDSPGAVAGFVPGWIRQLRLELLRHVAPHPRTEHQQSCPVSGASTRRANSDTAAFQYGFGGNLGYQFNARQLTITPVARVQYVKADVSSYEESGASPINLGVGSQDVKSLTTNLGASLGYAFSTSYGVVEPTICAEYVHEFGMTTTAPHPVRQRPDRAVSLQCHHRGCQ